MFLMFDVIHQSKWFVIEAPLCLDSGVTDNMIFGIHFDMIGM